MGLHAERDHPVRRELDEPELAAGDDVGREHGLGQVARRAELGVPRARESLDAPHGQVHFRGYGIQVAGGLERERIELFAGIAEGLFDL